MFCHDFGGIGCRRVGGICHSEVVEGVLDSVDPAMARGGKRRRRGPDSGARRRVEMEEA